MSTDGLEVNEVTRSEEGNMKNIIIAGVVAALVAAGAATATTKLVITSAQIKNGTIKMVDISASAKRGLKGNRGLRGLQGQQGSQGLKGDKGDIGPSNAYYAHDTVIGNLPPGDYVVYGQAVNDNSTGEFPPGTASVTPIFAGTGASGQTPTSYGTVAVGAKVTIPFQGIGHLPAGGAIGDNNSYVGSEHHLDLTAIRVGSVTP
jgi:hypothetical protein